MYERDLVGEPREEVRLFERGVAATDDRDLVAAEKKKPVAGRARGDTVPEQALLVRESEHARLGTGRDDDRASEFVVAADAQHVSGWGDEIDLVDVGG